MDRQFVVLPIERAEARKMCEDHPHAGTLPNSSKYYLKCMIDGLPAGLAVWGWGIVPRQTPAHLFGDNGNINDYLELCRYFVYDWTPKYTASRFLSFTHRLLKKYTRVKWLYTYAAGFQGLLGYIYQASNYDYIGKQLCKSFTYIPGVGLLHDIAVWHRYSVNNLKLLQKIYPGARTWCGYNFRYIYWLCDQAEKDRLMQTANFTIHDKYPTEEDLQIWLVDEAGNKTPLTPDFAKTIPIVKLKSNRGGDSLKVKQQALQSAEGGAVPTSPLHNMQNAGELQGKKT